MLKKRKRTNRLLASRIHHQQQQRLLRKKRELKKYLTNIVAKKKKILISCQLQHFSLVTYSLSACYWRKNVMIVQHIYVYICSFAIIDWIHTDDCAYRAVYTHSSRVPVKRMLVKKWRKKENENHWQRISMFKSTCFMSMFRLW